MQRALACCGNRPPCGVWPGVQPAWRTRKPQARHRWAGRRQMKFRQVSVWQVYPRQMRICQVSPRQMKPWQMKPWQEGVWLVQVLWVRVLRMRVLRMRVCLVRVRWVWGRQMWVWQKMWAWQKMRVWQARVRACLVWVWQEQTWQEPTGQVRAWPAHCRGGGFPAQPFQAMWRLLAIPCPPSDPVNAAGPWVMAYPPAEPVPGAGQPRDATVRLRRVHRGWRCRRPRSRVVRRAGYRLAGSWQQGL